MSIKISEEYKEQLKQIHSGTGKKMGWGLEPPAKLVETINQYKPQTILDYGCGSGAMKDHMQDLYPTIKLDGYDPGMPEYQTYPKTVDLIYSTDVFEHIEPAHIDSTHRQHTTFVMANCSSKLPQNCLFSCKKETSRWAQRTPYN